MGRMSWDKYFLTIASAVRERSTCKRLSVGCVIVKDNKVISTGYNGSPVGEVHCSDVGCLMHKGSCVRTIHAEMNGILNSLQQGVGLKGSTLYVTHYPCYGCAKHIVQVGVSEVVYLDDYRNDDKVKELFKGNNIKVRKANETEIKK